MHYLSKLIVKNEKNKSLLDSISEEGKEMGSLSKNSAQDKFKSATVKSAESGEDDKIIQGFSPEKWDKFKNTKKKLMKQDIEQDREE